jgi:hypothetical protein
MEPGSILYLFPVCEVLFPGDRAPVHKWVLLRFHKRSTAPHDAQDHEGKKIVQFSIRTSATKTSCGPTFSAWLA